jgi:hypothetical protein
MFTCLAFVKKNVSQSHEKRLHHVTLYIALVLAIEFAHNPSLMIQFAPSRHDGDARERERVACCLW